MTRSRATHPVLVVGAGMAGLCCALELQRRGLPVQLLESDGRVGGRVRTDEIDGFLLDRGFQVLLTAYPEVQTQLDLDALQLGYFAPGARIQRAGSSRTVEDPFRRPRSLLRTALSGAATPLDGLRLARLWNRVRAGAPLDLLSTRAQGFEEALAQEGFSRRVIDGFFRPFFGGVLLDPQLQSSSRSLAFFFRMFAEGDIALPAEGMEAIPRQLAARLSPGVVRCNTPVASIEGTDIELASGETIEGSAIVIATSASAALRLVPDLPIPESHATLCLQFAAPAAPPVGPFLVLDGIGSGPINHLCVPSEVAASYAPSGQALISASVLGLPSDESAVEAQARAQLTDWFGPAVAQWRLLRTDRIPEALPAQPPGPFQAAEREVLLRPGLFACGDHRDIASLQGAMGSGRRAARAVAEALG